MQRLGQHFLKNKAILHRIAESIDPQPGDILIEVGPGHGELTETLKTIDRGSWIVDHKSKLILIEKDEQLAAQLQTNYAHDAHMEIVRGDALVILPKIVRTFTPFSFKVIGNIPYYLTGRLFRVIFESRVLPKSIVFTIQKEVAERILAQPPSMNLLAVSVQIFGTPELVCNIPRNDFDPPPKVDSATIKVTSFTTPFMEDTPLFFTVVKAGFSHPRKILISNLVTAGIAPKVHLESLFHSLGISLTARAQELSLESWYALIHLLKTGQQYHPLST